MAQKDLAARVPTCPDWTNTDLLRHVATVFLHKAKCMQLNAEPKPWPPDLTGEEPIALLDRAYRELTAEFAWRDPSAPAASWYEPDQSVAFWIRRMAQEAVIHRIDAELAVGGSSHPVPDDLAVDGIDELLVCFLSYGSVNWPTYFVDSLGTTNGEVVRVASGGSTWELTLTPAGVTVGSSAAAAATISAAPDTMVRWLWRRTDPGAIEVEGDQGLVDKLWAALEEATQ